MKNILLIGFCYIFLESIAVGQLYTVSGYINDSISGEVLISATCLEMNLKKGVISNSSGYYSITLPKGEISIKVSYVGYRSSIIAFNLRRDTSINFNLTSVQLSEVFIAGKSESTIKQTNTGLEIIPINTIKAVPSMIGVPDLIKAITFLPGVSPGRDGISEFFVRGGDRGQNLIMLDGAKIYNSNHVGGFVSLFNPDAIKSVDLYKGGFPARFGGRASSVLDIHAKEGNINTKHSKLMLGIMQSSILFEGPIKDQNTSYLIAARASYLDLLTLPIRLKFNIRGEGSIAGYTFFDLNMKLNQRINDRNKIFANLYSGSDFQGSEEKSKLESTEDHLQLNTNILTIGHTFVPNNKMFLKTSLIYSGYRNKISSAFSSNYYLDNYFHKSTSTSTIKELSLKSFLEWNPEEHHSLKTGIELSKYNFLPGRVHIQNRDSILTSRTDTIIGSSIFLNSVENSIFIEDDISINKFISLYTGFRIVGYHFNKSIEFKIEPRLSMRVMLSDFLSAKVNYTRMVQYNHSLVSNYQGFERDVWIAATDSIPPQQANQFSAGLYGEIPAYKTEFSIEGYYKKMYDLIDYRSATGAFNDFSDLGKVITKGGKGWSYGLEFLLQRSVSPLSATLSYTLSWSYRQFNELNNGIKFPFRYDRRHALSILTAITLNRQYSLNTNFIMSTGTPFTLPVSYSKDNRFYYGYFNYSGINSMKLPLYHRLDVGIEKRGKTKKGNTKVLSVNIYNVYAHQNPVYVYYNPYNGKSYQKSFFSIVPSISYSVDFK